MVPDSLFIIQFNCQILKLFREEVTNNDAKIGKRDGDAQKEGNSRDQVDLTQRNGRQGEGTARRVDLKRIFIKYPSKTPYFPHFSPLNLA